LNECIKIDVLLVNRTPNLILNSKSSFEILYDKIVN